MTTPFAYPAERHIRRHGPAGYAKYDSFRPWLRDEFAFRCVFCLTRERWGPLRSQFAIDHFTPATIQPDAPAEYDNLLYCCITCNSAKSDRLVPDPLRVCLSDAIQVDRHGTIHGETHDADRLIELIDLNNPRMVEFRKLWIDVVSLAERLEPELLRRVLGFPDELPDLSRLRPPGGNGRPDGIADSHYARRVHGRLPNKY